MTNGSRKRKAPEAEAKKAAPPKKRKAPEVEAKPPATKKKAPKVEARAQATKKAAPPPIKKSKAVTALAETRKLGFLTSGERGVVLTLGTGDTGQLGLGEDVMERKRPGLVSELEGVVDVAAGGMHSICLTHEGRVYTFGCNDEGALGRPTPEEEECFTPGEVDVPGKVVQITAGDSHSVALTQDGKVFYWGNFRDSSGPFGLTEDGRKQEKPIPLAHHLNVK